MEKKNNKSLIEVTPKKALKNLMILILLINIPLFSFKGGSKKLIIEKSIFIDDCSKDDIYQYEYNNICYISCPRGTQISKTNKNLCEIKSKMISEIKATNKTYEINNSSSSLNNIFIKAKLRKMQLNDDNNAIIELRNKIKNKTDTDMIKLLKGELKEIKKTHKDNPYQIITTNYHNNNDNDNDKVSTIKIGECENILKNHYNIQQNDSLIIFKYDYYAEGLLVPIIEYEVYDSNRNILSLNYCKDVGIEISVPLLTKKEEEACIQLCDDNCEFLSYSSDNKKYKCICEVKESMPCITGIEPKSWNKEGNFKNYCELKNDNINMDKSKIIDLKQDFKNGNLNRLISDVIGGYDIVIKNKNFIVQVATTDYHRYNNYHNSSTINLGDCENKLRIRNNIADENPLFIFKVDSYNEDSLIPIVEYEVYQQINNKFEILEIDELCKDIMINIKIPTDLSEEETVRYNLSNNEICYSYEEENGKDISLKDRKKEDKALCQSNCAFEGYNSYSKMINCGCQAKEGISLVPEITFDKNVELDTYDSPDSSDSSESSETMTIFECTNYFFSKEGFQNNSGSYILLCLISLNIVIFVIFYLFNGRAALLNEINKLSNSNQISNYNNAAINNNVYNNNNENNNVYNNANAYNNGYNINNAYNNGYNNNPDNNDITHVNFENNNALKSKKKGRSNKRKNSQKSNKGKSNKKNENTPQISVPPKKNKINKNNNDLKVNVDTSRKPDSNIEFRNIENQGSLRNINNMPVLNNNINYNYNLTINYQINNQMNNQIIIIEGIQNFNYNDYELNHMTYKEALLYDKRTYFQYYLSLIKTKHMIYFTFILKTDYNPTLLKYSIFILAFCFIFVVNTIFIGDVSLLNKDEKFIYQIPQFIYIIIIFSILTEVIKYFFLPEKEIVKLRYIEKGNVYEYAKKTNYIRCNFKIYFLVNFILLFFIWFYVGLFCAVYRNTQTYLIKNVFISLAIYLLYPFIFYFIPGFFRIPSLKSTKRNKQCLYRIGNYLGS